MFTFSYLPSKKKKNNKKGSGLYFPPPAAPPLNCSNPPFENNATFYPAGQSVGEYQGTNYTVPCSQSVPSPVPADVYCQPPLSPSYDVVPGVQICAFSCPLPSLTDSQYDSAKAMQGIMGWFSWV